MCYKPFQLTIVFFFKEAKKTCKQVVFLILASCLGVFVICRRAKQVVSPRLSSDGFILAFLCVEHVCNDFPTVCKAGSPLLEH